MNRCSPPRRAIELVAGPQVQVIGVAEDDRRADVLEVAQRQRLDRAARADRHERRRLDVAVRRARARRGARAPSRCVIVEVETPRGHCGILPPRSRVPLPSFPSGPVNVKRLRVGVIYGGRSGEHEVSLASAAAVFANLDRERYDPVAIRIEKDGRWTPARPSAHAGRSAAEVIEQARPTRRAPLRAARDARCTWSPRPGEDTLLAIERRRLGRAAATATARVVRGLGARRGLPGAARARTAKTARCRACSSWPTCPTSAPACWPRRSGMDKAVAKVLFAARGLRVAD